MGIDKMEKAIEDCGGQCKSKDNDCECQVNKQHRGMTLRGRVEKLQKPQTATKPEVNKNNGLVSRLKMVNC